MKALITGITGFVGSHLADHLLSQGIEVYGTTRLRSPQDNISHIKDKIKLLMGDVRDAHSIESIVEEVKPDYIFHLAAQIFVPMSWKAPSDTIETNVTGTINLLEAVRKSKTNPKIHIPGSSEEYGLAYPEETPIKETNPLRPLSPYGVSKVAEDLIGWQYFKSYGMNIVRTRAFSHAGPRMGEAFVTSNFAKQIAEIEKGIKKPIIYVGNLNAGRDFTDVRDIVKAYWLAVNKCRSGEVYNICSGKSMTIRSVLDLQLSMTKKKIEIKTDESRLRPSDTEKLVGDCSMFRKETGWKPEIPLDKTMKDVLDYWREKL